MIKTQRLLLRPWREEDFEPFARLNGDPKVMEYFPSVLTREESDDLARRICGDLDKKGWGAWAVSVPGVAEFIGFIGLAVPSFDAHFTPAVEVGWRLAYEYWGHGYATEGALAALQYGFEALFLNEIVSFTAMDNLRSRRVMERIGMHRNPEEDFNHPKLAVDHPLCRHVLYKMNKNEWEKAK